MTSRPPHTYNTFNDEKTSIVKVIRRRAKERE